MTDRGALVEECRTAIYRNETQSHIDAAFIQEWLDETTRLLRQAVEALEQRSVEIAGLERKVLYLKEEISALRGEDD